MHVRRAILVACAVTVSAAFVAACEDAGTEPGPVESTVVSAEVNGAPDLAQIQKLETMELAEMDLSAAAAAPTGGEGTIYTVVAHNARVNRRVVGPVEEEIRGVPARPVDSFVWDGDGSNPIRNAVAVARLNPVENSGLIRVQWRDEHGLWSYTQRSFSPPEHPSGARIGSSVDEVVLITGDPVTTNVYLHGNTTAGGPVLPTLFNLLATWGPVEVTLNGAPFENPFDGPAPLWAGHTMTSEGARADDGSVRTEDGGIFSATAPDQGAVSARDMEFHVVFHDGDQPMVSGNFPPIFDFFYHLVFEDVQVSVSHQ